MISIIVPIYNVEPYVEKCIQSLRCQTYTDLQIILVDDGSTDRSGVVCDSFAQLDSRIDIIHQKNQGLVAARKAGLNVAKGDYIGFVDGDDYIEPEMYEKLYQCITTMKVDAVHSNYLVNNHPVEGPNGYIQGDIEHRLKRYVFGLEESSGIAPGVVLKLFRADAIRKCYAVVPNSQSYGEDLLCLTEAICSGYSFYCLDNAYYHYIIRDDSISHKKSLQNYQREVDLYQCLCKIVLSHNLLDEMEKYLDIRLNEKMLGVALELSGTRQYYVQYRLPMIESCRNKNIVLYGAGTVGNDYYAQLSKYEDCKIVAWVDREYEKYNYDYYCVQPIETILDMDYDFILVAIARKEKANIIRENLYKMGIASEKIVWEKPQKYGEDISLK